MTVALQPSPSSSTPSFPLKLYNMLEEAEEKAFDHIISWQQGDESSFLVHEPGRFTADVIKDYFGASKYKSFQRKLNKYGWKIIQFGPLKGGYKHPHFIRGRPDLLDKIQRRTLDKIQRRIINSSKKEALSSSTPTNKPGSEEQPMAVRVSPKNRKKGETLGPVSSRRFPSAAAAAAITSTCSASGLSTTTTSGLPNDDKPSNSSPLLLTWNSYRSSSYPPLSHYCNHQHHPKNELPPHIVLVPSSIALPNAAVVTEWGAPVVEQHRDDHDDCPHHQQEYPHRPDHCRVNLKANSSTSSQISMEEEAIVGAASRVMAAFRHSYPQSRGATGGDTASTSHAVTGERLDSSSSSSRTIPHEEAPQSDNNLADSDIKTLFDFFYPRDSAAAAAAAAAPQQSGNGAGTYNSPEDHHLSFQREFSLYAALFEPEPIPMLEDIIHDSTLPVMVAEDFLAPIFLEAVPPVSRTSSTNSSMVDNPAHAGVLRSSFDELKGPLPGLVHHAGVSCSCLLQNDAVVDADDGRSRSRPSASSHRHQYPQPRGSPGACWWQHSMQHQEASPSFLLLNETIGDTDDDMDVDDDDIPKQEQHLESSSTTACTNNTGLVKNYDYMDSTADTEHLHDEFVVVGHNVAEYSRNIGWVANSSRSAVPPTKPQSPPSQSLPPESSQEEEEKKDDGGDEAVAAVAAVEDQSKPPPLPPPSQEEEEEKDDGGEEAAVAAEVEDQSKSTNDSTMVEVDDTCTRNFPSKLHRLLENAEADNYDDVVSWVRNGRAFQVHDHKAFMERVMPLYFDQSKYQSFRRQLNLYSFARISKGKGRGTIYHPKFIRGDLHLCGEIKRKNTKNCGG